MAEGEEGAVIETGHAATPGSDAEDRRAELDLARRARRGDGVAFGELVQRFHRPVYRFCWRLLRSSDAEDLAQDTFVRAFVHFERFDPERPVLPWLIAIARRLCLDLLRRRKVMASVETLPVAGPSAPGPEGEASLREQLRGTLRVGTILEPGFIRLGPFVRSLTSSQQKTEVFLRHGMSDDVLTQIGRGELDVGYYIMGGTIIQHLLGLRQTADINQMGGPGKPDRHQGHEALAAGYELRVFPQGGECFHRMVQALEFDDRAAAHVHARASCPDHLR